MLEAMTESIESVADRIARQTCLVAETDGKIVGSGTHKELLRDCQLYRDMAKLQEYEGVAE